MKRLIWAEEATGCEAIGSLLALAVGRVTRALCRANRLMSADAMTSRPEFPGWARS